VACAAERYPLPKGGDALRFQFGISRRRRSADCGNGLSAQCVRLRSEINQTELGSVDMVKNEGRRFCVTPRPGRLL